ncbi:MAG: nucleoside deaminase [Bacilli bacterium]
MECFFDIAFDEAKKASLEGNVPVGAVIVRNGKMIASAHNTKNTSKIAINHAEILCIVDACKCLGSWYLDDCIMFVTLKPCDMCLSAIAEARIKEVYYLIDSNYEVNLNKNKDNISFHKSSYKNNSYVDMLSLFFKDKRL